MNKNLLTVLILLISVGVAEAEMPAVGFSYYNGTIRPTNVQTRSYSVKPSVNAVNNPTISYINKAEQNLREGKYSECFKNLIYVNRQPKTDEIKNKTENLYQKLKSEQKTADRKQYYYSVMALLSLISGDVKRAESDVTAALSGQFDAVAITPAILEVLKSSSQKDYCVAVCDRLLEQNPDNSAVKKFKSDFLSGDKTKQQGSLENSAINRQSLYELYKRSGSADAEFERKAFNTVYHITEPEKKDYERLYSDLADILTKKGEYEGAIRCAKILLDKYPNGAEGYIILSELYLKSEQPEEAYKILQNARDKADTNEQISKYNVLLAKLSGNTLVEAHSLMNAGLYKQALELLETSEDTDNMYVIISEARAAYFCGQKKKSFDYLAKAASLYPDHADVDAAYAYIYLQEKDIANAKNYIKKSLKTEPDNKTSLQVKSAIDNAEADINAQNAVDLIENGDFEKASHLIEKGLAVNPDNAVLYYGKAMICKSKNNYSAMLTNLKKCIELKPNYYRAYFYAGVASESLGDKAGAIAYYRKFVRLLPSENFDDSEKRDYALARIKKLQNN